jgi:secondary thiamine-phosphate synthase enzyme
MLEQFSIVINTSGRGTNEFTSEISSLVEASSIETGLCHIFIQHTSASLIITENADSRVRTDLENFIAKLVLDGDPAYLHDQEGADDMAAHIRSVLTQTELTLPISQGQLLLGSWQGLYLWEHRYRGHRRDITVTVSGNNA